MAFSTPVCASARRPGWLLAGLLLALAVSGTARADAAFSVRDVHTDVDRQVYHLDADIDYTLTVDALDALQNGVPLSLKVFIEVYKHRNWWWDKRVASLVQRYRLRYHALAEKYLVQNLNSGAQETYSSLAAALRALGTIRDLPVIDQNLLDPDAAYWGRLRVELDIESLPAPLRPLAYLSSQWRLGSEWYEWSLTD